jgi:hypothetical protein
MNKKGRERSPTPGPCHFDKEQTPLGQLALPTRGFTAAVSVFRGTPPTKPFKCKICFALSGALADQRRTHHVGCRSTPAFADFNLAPGDIIKMSRCSYSQSVGLSLLLFAICHAGKIKTLLPFGKQGLRNLIWFFYLLTSRPSRLVSSFCSRYAMDRLRRNAQLGFNRQ